MGFSVNLRAIRKRNGYSQRELAEALEVSLSSVAMWETDNRHPDYEMLTRIADLFDVTFDELLGDAETISCGRDANSTMSDEIATIREMIRSRPEVRTLFSVSRNSTKEDIEKSVAIIEALKESTENQSRKK